VLPAVVLVIFAEESCTNCCKGTVKPSDDEEEDDGGGGATPVTLTLYHFVKLGGHSILAVILLFGPSLMKA
jgi:hypothetical protein